MHKLLFVVLAVTCCCHTAFSQDTRLSLSPKLHIPLGKMSWSYKPAVGAELNFSRINTKRGAQSAYGFSFGYASFAPKADTLYYVVDQGGVDGASLGKAAYSAFKMYHLKVTLDYAFPIGKKNAITYGVDIGIVYGKRTVYFEDATGTNDLEELGAWGTLSPWLGFEFIMSENFSLVPNVSYTVMMHAGSSDVNSYSYNPSAGFIYQFFTPGISINYNF